jgi:MFS family permease
VLVRVSFFTKGMTIPARRFLAVILLFSSSFAWFQVFYTYLDEIVSPGIDLNSFWFQAGVLTFLAFTGVSAFLGCIIAGKVNRRKFLLSWLVSGVLAAIPMFFFRGEVFLVVWGAVAGATFGTGFPTCMAFLADSTSPDERGRVAGLAIFLTFVLMVFSILLRSVLGLGAAALLLLTVCIKSIGFVSFGLDPVVGVQKKPKPWHVIMGYSDFNRYLVAFVLFVIAAALVSLLWNTVPIYSLEYNAVYRIGQIARYLGLIVFGLFAGVLADRIGRKKPIIVGLVMLGAAYAIVGLATTPATFIVNFLLSAFAWGIIMVVYLVVPGDLAFAGSTEILHSGLGFAPDSLHRRSRSKFYGFTAPDRHFLNNADDNSFRSGNSTYFCRRNII